MTLFWRLFFSILFVLFFTGPAQAHSSGWVKASHLKAELVSDHQDLRPGQRFKLALHFIPDEHWHTYWQNPGDSGLATSIDWTLPDGVEAGAIQWPAPMAISVPPLVNYGFEGPTILVSELSIPVDFKGSQLQIKAKVDWLVCKEICIPADASFELNLPVTQTAVLATDYLKLFEKASQQQPKAVPLRGRYDVQNQQFSAAVPMPEDLKVSAFFVAAAELVDHAAPQQIDWVDGELLLRQQQNTYFNQAPEQFDLVLNTAAGPVLLQLQHESAPQQSAISLASFSLTDWLVMVALAAVGGLILNLMPCVFPVLSLKALSLVNGQQSAQHTKAEALWYSAGVVLSFVLLAAMLLVLRSAGEAVGWGFQLQNPLVVGLLAYLLFVLALSLSGVVQLGLGLMNSGQQLTEKPGARGSFFTGVLAVVVASPCTAPFMGTALGYAATQPALAALAIFAALGLGMALPFLALAWSPGFAALLPKPGLWMEKLKQWLAYPLYLSAVWLLWVYGRQQGIDALALALVGLVFVAAACWLWGLLQLQQAGKASAVMAVLLFAGAVALLWYPQPATQQSAKTDHAEVWSEQRLKQLLQDGKPVLVNMTADWCITCLVNERVALDTDSSKAAMALYNLTYLKGDWTNKDPAISAYLRQFQRDGVPLYVLYWPGQPPEVLPQILTPDSLRQALEQLSSKQPLITNQ
ncbi:protein-disulfide reductase DsbD family protein [Rheinheimera tangshanensis]|jgi:thiol:disulfide interchange protein DsbD|uniref:Thiol:disulfide interchange protein n=1 Tax=Rheinheimera tangshanensis TaxID=400153 RepID=A0A5C8LSH7_9GAMM|nr:protein-disulfide reductase DsbD domain-containing protein [Rheinheimera tangshanensis]TXK80311.1 thiol:disulfide interchange protein [Rheinheimera tangshanensis]